MSLLLVKKCACLCLLKMGKPSLWSLPIDNATSHMDLTFFKKLLSSHLTVDWSLLVQHKLLSEDLF